MKNIYILSFIAVLLVACGVPELNTEMVERAYSVAFEEGGQDSLQIEMALEWPVKGLPPVSLQNMQKNLITAIFGKEESAPDIDNAFSRYCTREETEYKESITRFMSISESDETRHFSWSEIKDGRFLEPYNDMQSYRLYTYGYTGGAHGIDTETGLTFSLSSGERLYEKDIFTNDYKQELSRILTKLLPEAVSADNYEMLFIKELEPNENFYIDPEGVTYIYGRYEIGPYVSGIVRITASWDELKGILR